MFLQPVTHWPTRPCIAFTYVRFYSTKTLPPKAGSSHSSKNVSRIARSPSGGHSYQKPFDGNKFAERNEPNGVVNASKPPAEKFRILFFGTDEFAAKHLKSLVRAKSQKNSVVESIDLVCPPDRWTGRKKQILTPSPTRGLAELYNIPVHFTPAGAKNLKEWQMPEKEYDLGVVVSFGYFIPPPVIQSFKYGAINVHPSLLPRHRGAAPIQHTILAGDDETGVTVQELSDKAFDAGRILTQKTLPLDNTLAPRFRDLKDELAGIGSDLLLNTLSDFHAFKANAKEQDESHVTQAPKIEKSWSHVDFTDMTAWQIEQLHRAIGDQYPIRTTFTFSRIKRSKKIKQRFHEVQLLNIYMPESSPVYELDPPLEPGWFMYVETTAKKSRWGKDLHIVCADGNVIAVPHVKVADKDVVSARDFKNGYEIHNDVGWFGHVEEDEVTPGMSGVRITKRREEYAKSIRKRMGLRKKDFERLYRIKLNARE
ncbi:formyl transferase [Syncephalastrum racemosum]|uniref:Methionyl-tRNA formyltransferase, mitochondrial n=1 Tax=Syncephalastrum racemosum TaxID=13706 RepID=A0A1X2HLU2_SYNRA|nr:formyl transferase [Syncephalastrum racemosum]